jgi:hypothetical protein
LLKDVEKLGRRESVEGAGDGIGAGYARGEVLALREGRQRRGTRRR